ncbi:MAG: hypothetical protein ACE5OR_00315 [bacterium]
MKRISLYKSQGGSASFVCSRQSVFVNHSYFYLNDADFGPAFIKMCSCVPFPIEVYLNGHEWVKGQLEKRGIGFDPPVVLHSCADFRFQPPGNVQ